MKFLPVIDREFRSESRQSMNYWMRVLCALAMMTALLLTVVFLDGNVNGKGGVLFGVLQPTLFSLIWILGATLTCDCISRERRDGTLGLLFLTPLRPWDIVISKALSGLMRTATVILSSLPIMAIPVLLGGVSGPDLIRATLMNLMALIASVTAGMYASTRCREFSRAAILAVIGSAVLMVLLGDIIIAILLIDGNAALDLQNLLFAMIMGPWVICSGVDGVWTSAPFFVTSPFVLWIALGQVMSALLLAVLMVFHLNRILPRLAVETGMSKRQMWWWKLLCTPRVFKGTLSRSHRALLNRNPIGWLQRRTWSSRLATWSWMGVVTMGLSVVLLSGGHWNDLMGNFTLLMLALMTAIAFSAADSFRAERETGALELLLVTPLNPSGILMGRLFGIWGQYFLAIALLGVLFYYATPISYYGGTSFTEVQLATIVLLMTAFVCVPIVGVSQSLNRRHFFSAWLLTVLWGIVLPMGIPLVLLWLLRQVYMIGGMGMSTSDTAGGLMLICLLLVALAGWHWRRARYNLSQRSFLALQAV